MHSRVLLLGPTGVDKSMAASRILRYLHENFARSARFIDFEKDFLRKKLGQSASRGWTTFISQDMLVQGAAWRAAWDEFRTSLDSEMTILGMHATYVSGVMGLRCPIDIPRICSDFRPTLIITLIDDVYSMWRRTEERASGNDLKGRPSLEFLLSARRSEQIIGDLLVTHLGDPQTRHIVCASANVVDALVNLILFDARVTYLSFPISAPRKLEVTGDRSFIELIDKAHAMAANKMKENRKRAFVSPLAIDELPLLNKAKSESADNTDFDCRIDRWDAARLWGSGSELIVDASSGAFPIPSLQLGAAKGMIGTDVGWRDRRLVQQADSLAIVCPKPPNENRITRGVNDEIQTATAVGTPCLFWQKPEWDSEDYVGNVFPDAGSMGISQTGLVVKRVGTLAELIDANP